MKIWEPEIGEGLYTTSDVVMFEVCPSKVNRWLTNYWKPGGSPQPYILDKRSKVFGFHAFIELYTIAKLREMGVSFRRIYQARSVLVREFKTVYPFALGALLSDGKTVLVEVNSSTLLNLNKHGQYELTDVLRDFCRKIDFGKEDNLAERFWPLGKDAAIVVDPRISFGRPCINGTGVQADVIYNLHRAGEKKSVILDGYRITEAQYSDALSFAAKYRAAA